jgi:uncharacterized membrane protein
MEPAVALALLWMVFAGTHIGLATRRIRGALVARLGEWGFAGLFSAVASVSFAVAIVYYADHRTEGAAGLALGAIPALRWILVTAAVAGVVLVSAGSVGYPGSPYDQFGRMVRSPHGIERITRHPFFAGVALFAGAHALLSAHLVGTVLFGGIALLAIVGPVHQDAKMRARRGGSFGDYLSVTSAVPFGAVLTGRQRIVWRELPAGALVAGLAVAAGLRAVHDSIFAHGGLWVIVAVVGGAAVFGWVGWRRARRLATDPHVTRTATAAGAHR